MTVSRHCSLIIASYLDPSSWETRILATSHGFPSVLLTDVLRSHRSHTQVLLVAPSLWPTRCHCVNGASPLWLYNIITWLAFAGRSAFEQAESLLSLT